MFSITTFTVHTTRFFHHWLREIAYDDMSHQASDWIPDELRTEAKASRDQPIQLNFGVPKKHRLNWIHRTIDQLPD